MSFRFILEVVNVSSFGLSLVIQNHLQFVAISNLEAATFQVSYQLKILTTAAFSVLLLRRKLSCGQWVALCLLAIGVGVVQVQSNIGNATPTLNRVLDTYAMDRVKGITAVIAACCTSGLAGVYFEMVLKNTSADVWVRNVQLSMFSLLPALSPIFFTYAQSTNGLNSWSIASLFENFGVWAWATILTQVAGGLVTAIVIKYSDNILKGFATSLSIVISFLASVALFNFVMTFTFLLGSFIVLIATWLYNQPPRSPKDDAVLGHCASRRGMSCDLPCCDDNDALSMSSMSLSQTLTDAWEQDKTFHSSPSFGTRNNASV
jgi:solute carrier family 35 (UDP-sugar transporter), member A1/2/3